MQVNSTSSYTPQSSQAIGGQNQISVNDQSDRLAVQPTLPKNDSDKASADNANKEQQTRLDIDQEAINLVEQNQAVSVNQNSLPNNSNSSKASYDQPSQQNQTAALAYQSVDNLAKRDTIQQAFGVDLYA